LFAATICQAGTYAALEFDGMTPAPQSEIPLARDKLRAYDTAVTSRLIVSHSSWHYSDSWSGARVNNVFTTSGRSGRTRLMEVTRIDGTRVVEDSVWFTSPQRNISYNRLNLTGRIRPDAAVPIPSDTSLLAPTNQPFLSKMEDILDFQQNAYYLSKDKNLLIIVNGSFVFALSRHHSYFPSVFQIYTKPVAVDAWTIKSPHIQLQVTATGFYYDASDKLHWPQSTTESNWQVDPDGNSNPWFEVVTTIQENRAIGESDLRAEIPHGYLILDEDTGTTSIVGAQ
jgi:hypothetical protein